MRRAGSWLTHPATVYCVVALLLNDHVAKERWPGLITGKVSDFAGLVVVTPMACLLFAVVAHLAAQRRPRWRSVLTSQACWVTLVWTSCLVIGATFAVMKGTSLGAETASHWWTWFAGPSLVREDASDLVALLTLPFLGLWMSRSERHHQLAPQLLRRRVLAVIPLVVLATAATSKDVPCSNWSAPNGYVAVYVYDGWLVQPGARLLSNDGIHWRSFTKRDMATELWRPPTTQNRLNSTVACDPRRSKLCWGKVGDSAIAETTDGGQTWEIVGAVSPEASASILAPFAEHTEAACDLGATLENTVGVLPRRNGAVVVVPMRNGDFLTRTVSGTWQVITPTLTNRGPRPNHQLTLRDLQPRFSGDLTDNPRPPDPPSILLASSPSPPEPSGSGAGRDLGLATLAPACARREGVGVEPPREGPRQP